MRNLPITRILNHNELETDACPRAFSTTFTKMSGLIAKSKGNIGKGNIGKGNIGKG